MNFNKQILKQARDMVNRDINESPENIIVNRVPLVDDGMDGMVPDPFGVPVPHNIKCRISHERKFADYSTNPVGLSSNLERYILVNWEDENIIYEDDVFEAIGKSFRIGVVDPLKKFEGVIGFQAPLIESEITGAGS